MALKGPGRGRAEDDLTAILNNLQDDYRDGRNDASNLARIKYGKMVVARGGVHSKPKRDEFEARIEAAYKQGYRDGRRELWDEIKRKRIAGGPRLGRPPKYEFSRLKVGGKLATTEHNTRNVYAAARQWAQRHAPSRRFRVRPAKGGCVVTRTT